MSMLTQTGPRSIEVTGLSEGTIRVLEELVAALRGQQKPSVVPSSYEEWSRSLREWVESHASRDAAADWSRECIYVESGQ